MANIHILDNGNSFNNGVMAMALGFYYGLMEICGHNHSVIVVLNSPQTFIASAQRYRRYGLATASNGLAMWRSGLPKCGRIFSRILPITGNIWAWGQQNDIEIINMGDWRPQQADIMISLCGEDYFSDNWSPLLCKFVDIQYTFLEVIRIPHVIMAQTFGPFDRNFSRSMAVKHLTQAALVTARDDVSYENLTGDLGITGNVHRTGDLGFLMESDRWDIVQKHHAELHSLNFVDIPWVGVSVSYLFAKSVFKVLSSKSERIVAFFIQIAKGLDTILEKKDDIRVIFTPHVTEAWNDDRNAAKNVIKRMKFINRVVSLQDEYTAPEIKSVIGRCDAFIGCRMHALIAAISQAVPTLPLAYSPKTMDVIGKAMDFPFTMDFRNIDPNAAGGELARQFSYIWGQRKRLSIKIEQKVQKTKALSYHNLELLKPFLQDTSKAI